MIGKSADKNFAYILGVYLGDGCVSVWRGKGRSDRLQFRLNTIDEDFVQATKAALNELSGYTVSICCYAVSKSSKPNWALTLGDRGLCQRLIDDTERKRLIPEYVFGWPRDLKLAFIGGLMDSEGYVGEMKSRNRKWYMGFKSCDVWFMDFIRLLQSVGILVGKIGIEKLPSGKTSRRVSIKLHSWKQSGAHFNIGRKQARVDAWAAKLISETTRQTPSNAVMI